MIDDVEHTEVVVTVVVVVVGGGDWANEVEGMEVGSRRRLPVIFMAPGMNWRIALPAAKTSAIEDAERSISLHWSNRSDTGRRRVHSSFLGTVRTGIR